MNSLCTAKESVDVFGIRNFDWSQRVPEESEIFTREEAEAYIAGCDYSESVDDLLLALEIQREFGLDRLRRMHILDAMCGPGRLGREFLAMGVPRVTFHDGDEVMMRHARSEAQRALRLGQQMDTFVSPVDAVPASDNTFDLIVCHNATHQLASTDKLHAAMAELLRITRPGGFIVVADYQRGETPGFLDALEERLYCTRPEIVPLLIPSFVAAFSKKEFADVLRGIPGQRYRVIDAQPPMLTPKLQARIEQDPVQGHVMDYGPISLRAVVRKEGA